MSAFLLILVLSVGRGVVRAGLTGGDVIDHAVVAICTSTAIGLLMALAYFLHYRRDPAPSTKRVLLTLGFYVVLAAVQLAVANAIADRPPLNVPVNLGGAPAVIAISIVTAFALSQLDSYRDGAAALASQRDSLRTILAENESILAANRAEVSQLIRTRLDAPLRTIHGRLTNLTDQQVPNQQELSEIADQLTKVGTDLVRPLSHEIDDLADIDTRIQSDASQESGSRVLADGTPVGHEWLRVRDVVMWAIERHPFRPVVVGLSVAFAITSGAFGLNRPLAAAVIAGAVIALGLSIARTLEPKLKTNSSALRIVIVLVSYAVLGVLTLTATSIFNPAVMSTLGYPIFAAFGSVVVCALWALVGSVRDRARSALADLESTNAVISWEVAQRQVQRRRERKRLATILHSDIQSRLLMAAAAIDHAGNSGNAMHIRDRVTATKDMLDATAVLVAKLESSFAVFAEPIASLQAAFESVAGSWMGVVNIGLDFDPHCDVLVQRHPDRAASLIDITREAISNAVRHGRATSISITLRPRDRGIELLVVDDGSGISTGDPIGLGSKQLDRDTSEWSRRSIGANGTELRVVVPLLD